MSRTLRLDLERSVCAVAQSWVNASHSVTVVSTRHVRIMARIYVCKDLYMSLRTHARKHGGSRKNKMQNIQNQKQVCGRLFTRLMRMEVSIKRSGCRQMHITLYHTYTQGIIYLLTTNTELP